MPKNKASRRNVLKALAVASGTTAYAGVSQADKKDKFRKDIQQAHSIRENGGFEAYTNYLEAKGIETRAVSKEYMLMPEQEDSKQDGDISTQAIDDPQGKGIDITMSLSYPSYSDSRYYVELSWQYLLRMGYSPESTTEDPKDAIGFSWNSYCWDHDSHNLSETSISSEHVEFEEEAFGSQTFGFRVDDRAIGGETTCNYPCETYSDTHYGGVFLDNRRSENSNCDTISDTEIYGIYDHTYSGRYSEFGISASAPASIGITYKTDTYVDSTPTTTEEDDDGLVVSEGKSSSDED